MGLRGGGERGGLERGVKTEALLTLMVIWEIARRRSAEKGV